jgi:undecaprenyl-diphosphatase
MTVAQSVWGFIERRDVRLMRRVHRWRAPRWVRYWMLSATRLGDGWLWYSLGIILLLFGGAWRYYAVAAAVLAAVAGIFLFRALKKMSHRKRPCQLEPHCWSRVLPPDQFSFPSGHAMTAFSIALVVSAFYSYLAWPLYFIAASIAVSRIVLGMHFLSDVIVGALLGTGLGFASLALFSLPALR